MCICELHTPGIFDPCYFWPGAVYAGDGMCFLLVERPEHFDASKVGGTTATLILGLERERKMIMALMVVLAMLLFIIVIRMGVILTVKLVVIIKKMLLKDYNVDNDNDGKTV